MMSESPLPNGDAEALVNRDTEREFLANPDLDVRWRAGAPLNEPNPSTFYGGGALGYTDYPTLA